MPPTKLDDCLSVRDGHLFVEDIDSMDLIDRYGSPIFVFSEDQVRRNIRRFRDAFTKGWTAGPVDVMPAAKANWNFAVQRILADEGCGADIYSPGELDVVLRSGVPPERISVNGVPKDPEHIRRTIDVGARLTIDSLRDVDILEAISPDLERRAKVRLRLRPSVAEFPGYSDFVPEGPVPTDIVAFIYKGGLSFDEVVEAGRRVMALDNVDIVGVHQHHGRHRAVTGYWKAQMKAYAREIGKVCKALDGFKPEEIDIGGGFAIPRDPHNAAANYIDPYLYGFLYTVSHVLRIFGRRVRYKVLNGLLRFVSGHPNTRIAPTIEDYAEACTSTLLKELPRHGVDPKGVRLQLEPGRSVHGNAGVHLTTVQAVKHMTKPIDWNHVTIDTTEFWLTGGRFEHHLHDFRLANRVDAPATVKADVVGRSCYGDRLLGSVKLPEVEIGDVLALLDTGAYQEVSGSNFNAMPRPAAVLVTGDKSAVIRKAETLDDVFRRDRLPEHLQTSREEAAKRTNRRGGAKRAYVPLN